MASVELFSPHPQTSFSLEREMGTHLRREVIVMIVWFSSLAAIVVRGDSDTSEEYHKCNGGKFPQDRSHATYASHLDIILDDLQHPTANHGYNYYYTQFIEPGRGFCGHPIAAEAFHPSTV